jgi:hypothetical protein
MYFAGVEIPDVVLVIDGKNKNSTLFFTIDERTAESENIPLSLVRDPVSITGIENYLPYEAFSGFLSERLKSNTVIYTLSVRKNCQGKIREKNFANTTRLLPQMNGMAG